VESNEAKAWKPLSQNTYKNMQLPQLTNNISQFSLEVLQWLYKYYVFDDLIKKYKIAYVPEVNSLVLPVFEGEKLISYQQRSFPKKGFITNGDKTSPFLIKCTAGQENTVYLVEDYISAIRLGEHVNVICLFGVHISLVMLKFIENIDMNVKIWLDPDAPGIKASEDLLARVTKSMLYCAKYRAFAVREPKTVEVIYTPKQPKDYCDAELKEILNSRIEK